jgi:hypothetical protein
MSVMRCERVPAPLGLPALRFLDEPLEVLWDRVRALDMSDGSDDDRSAVHPSTSAGRRACAPQSGLSDDRRFVTRQIKVR